MPKPYDMPVHLVVHAPAVVSASGGIARAVLFLAVSYWMGGCRGLPDDEPSQAALARMATGAWRDLKPAVLAALREIEPELKAAKAKTDRQRQAQRLKVVKMNAARKQQRSAASAPARGDQRSVLPLPVRVAAQAQEAPAASEPMPHRAQRKQEPAALFR